MSISAPFIARPVATSLLAIALVVLGVLGYRSLPVSALPQVDTPTIQVVTQLPGASSETMSTLVTAPLERQFGLIPGLQSMLSTSAEGISTITLQFALTEDSDIAAQDIQAAINAAGGVLPANIPYPPSYSKVNPADLPILSLALTSDTLPMTDLNNTADTLLSQKLSQVAGVGRVLTEGGQRPAYRLQFDPLRLASYGLGLEDVHTILSNSNTNIPKGSFDGPTQAVALGINDQIADLETYKNIILATHNGNVVRVRDVANVIQDSENVRTSGWVNGKPAVIVDIQRQPGANIVSTVDAVKKLLPKLQSSIPAGIKVDILADRTQTIRASVNDVQFTMLLTICLVILVIYLFLHSARATIIPGVALPLSLLATLGVMSEFGYSLDNLSLMALTISAGFVVDDAIVMIENIVRYIEKGEEPLAAAYKGAKEIGFTVVSLTISLIAVLIPLLFMSGIIGRLFREFAMTLTIAVLASAIISLTLTPMMCGRMLKAGTLRDEHDSEQRGFFGRMHRLYASSLTRALNIQPLMLLLAVLTLVVTLALYVLMPKGFLPQQDTGQIIATTDASQSVSFAEMARLQERVANVIQRDEDVENVASFIGVGTINPTANTGHITVVLKTIDKRHASAQAIADRLNKKLNRIPGIETHLQVAQDIQIGARSSRTQYQYVLTDLDAAELNEWTGKFLAELKKVPHVADLTTDGAEQGLKADIQVNRDIASRLGVQAADIDNTLYDAFGQRQISTVYAQVNQYHVILEVAPQFQKNPQALESLYVKSSNGKMVQLGSFARVNIVPAPLLVTHLGQFPETTISFNLSAGSSLSDAVDAITKITADLKMPGSIVGSYDGEASEFQRSLSSEPLLILAAVFTIYIVLGVLYESTIHPVTILSTLPSAGVGALLALMITGNDISIVAIIGIVLLMGIVKKNAIMMIDFALVAERDHGMSPRDAIYDACLKRFRPIMMTTMAALLGAIPLAVDQGMGSELRRPLGIAIVGGLLLSQLLTLYTTPVIYLYMGRLSGWLRGGKKDERLTAVSPEHAG